MENEQQKEWIEAQNIKLSVDLVSAAKNQLKFLAAVDRNRYLYEGPTLDKAIYRYNAFWLPLLAKHSEDSATDNPLVVPLDCEWIWHCHRLNPVRYKLDCEKLFGRILDNHHIISSIQGTSTNKTKEIWQEMYPEEPYELDYNKLSIEDVSIMKKNLLSEKFTSYDLNSAVKRQSTFVYHVSRPHTSDDQFLQEALHRYKAFLHLIRINKRKKTPQFCVPTYDVDLMWHSHQLHPLSYCSDLCKLVGKVLMHDDTDSDKSKGSKLNVGFSQTTIQFEDSFGLRYWKAGAMSRGKAPNPVTLIPCPFAYEGGNNKFHALENNINNNLIQFPDLQAVEVFLEFVDVKNLPEDHKGELLASFSKKQLDKLFKAKKTLTISSVTGEKEVAYFKCEPSGEFLFELVCNNSSSNDKQSSKPFEPFGHCSLSLQECLASKSHQLFVDKCLPVVLTHEVLTFKPILLRVFLSFTPPTPAPQVFHLMRSQSPPKISKVNKDVKRQTHVTDDDGNNVLSLQMRDLSEDATKITSKLQKEVQYITDSGETHTLAEFKGNEWSIMGTNCTLNLHKVARINDGHLFELVGPILIRLFVGRKMDYESKCCDRKRSEQDYMTAIEFSAEYPYGRAVACIDFKNGMIKVQDKWMILTCITLAFILFNILKEEDSFAATIAAHDDNLPYHITSPTYTTIEAKVVAHDDNVPYRVTSPTTTIEKIAEAKVVTRDGGDAKQGIDMKCVEKNQ